jgi:hypothetical protein
MKQGSGRHHPVVFGMESRWSRPVHELSKCRATTNVAVIVHMERSDAVEVVSQGLLKVSLGFSMARMGHARESHALHRDVQ